MTAAPGRSTPISRRVTRRLAASAAAAALTVGSGAAIGATALSGSPTEATSQAAAGPVPEATGPTAYRFAETLAKLSGRRLETTFMAEIISHHRAAITMAKLETRRGRNPDIRTHASNIVTSQRDQVRQFTRWLKAWYGLTPAQAMDRAPAEAKREMKSMEQMSARDIKALGSVAAGPQFDVAFVKRMIPHHTAGVAEFLEPQSRAPHAQLRVAATSGIVDQESEIGDFRTWLAEQ